ncbi:MAG: TrkH family potassium uptake protein, partial [Novibacillus thermophilus]
LLQYPSRRRLSLHSKLSLIVYVLLWIIGTLFILVIEFDGNLKHDAWHEKILVSAFQSLTTRSAGFATADVRTFQLPTLLMMSLLMFIGASPSSSGGGIRTTTLATVVLAVRSFAKGTKEVSVFGRELDPADVRKAFVVAVFGVSLLVTALLILSVTEPFELKWLAFEIASAFGTCGLSVGITGELSSVGKVVLMVIMLTGRIGFGAILLMWRDKEKKALYSYPKERLIIG